MVNLSVDGESAKGRWYGFFLLSDNQGNASIQGGVFENEYVREDGKWKIGVPSFFPQYDGLTKPAGTIGKGRMWESFHTTSPGPKRHSDSCPCRHTANNQGLAGGTGGTDCGDVTTKAWCANLQASYGYYVNRRMWDDVTDLFTADGVYEVGGVGVYKGTAGVRRAVERMGPAGLTHGVLNDRLQFDTVVNFAASRREARVRGMELGLLGDADKGEAYWEVSVYDNRFVTEDGLWKVREMRVFPQFRSRIRKGLGQEPHR